MLLAIVSKIKHVRTVIDDTCNGLARFNLCILVCLVHFSVLGSFLELGFAMKSRSHRLPTISDTPDDWVDESWTVDCVCGVNFDDGEEMVDCDECGVWVHTRCSRYVKSEKLFACDKCKSKKLRKESEETEVAQLLVELPTKTLRMDSPYPLSCPSQNQNPFHVWTEVPMEEKVHVQGIPGGDPALFKGVSSLFSPELWKCTGYVPKKFNHQYREFPCWDNRQGDDNDIDDNKSLEETEKRASNGADALFLLSKENGGVKTEVNGGGGLDMGPPNSDSKKHEVENYESRRQHSVVKKERSLVKTIGFQLSNQKKDDSNRRKHTKSMEKDGEAKKRNHHHSSDSVATTSSDAKQSESNEGRGLRVFKTDKKSCKLENSRVDVQTNHKSDNSLDKNNSQPLENIPFDDSRINASKEAKKIEENDGNQVTPSDRISPKKENDMASSSLIQNHMETSPMKHEADHDVDDTNDDGRNSSRSNETRSNKNTLEKVDSAPNGEIHAPIEVKSVDINHPAKISNSQSDTKLDSSKMLAPDPKIPDDPSSASFEVKKGSVYVSQKAQKVDKTPPQIDTKPDEPDESPSGPTQPKLHVKGSESSIVARGSSDGQSKSNLTITSPSGVPNHRKVIVKKSSVPDKARYSNADDHKSSGKQKKASDNNIKIKKDNNGDASEKPKKSVKDLPKSSSTSTIKSSHLSKSSHVSKKNSSDLKSSSKTSSAAPESGDSANSSRSESRASRAHEPNKSTSEKTSQLSRQLTPKNHPPHVHPLPSTNSPATLSDEELALLLHQELNSSPRVPRVPRMRHAGSLPQLASGTSTSTLMKRTSTSVVKDNVFVSRKKNKDNVASNSREFDGSKKVDRMPSVSVSYSRRVNDHGSKNGSAKSVVDKSAPTASTTTTTMSSGPSSSNEATRNSPQNASDDETGAVGVAAHRTLPGLIAEIMSKGKRMTYEELCNAVLPHWPNLRKHNGERYAYSSHSQAVLDCLRNRSEWSRLVDRGPKTNAGRKRRKSESDAPNLESEEEEDDYSTDRNTKEKENDTTNEGKRKARKHRRLALQGRGIKDVRRRRKAEVVSDDELDLSSSSSDSSEEESEFSDEERKTPGPNEASASSDEMGTS